MRLDYPTATEANPIAEAADAKQLTRYDRVDCTAWTSSAVWN
jgi:hypothetical protein